MISVEVFFFSNVDKFFGNDIFPFPWTLLRLILWSGSWGTKHQRGLKLWTLTLTSSLLTYDDFEALHSVCLTFARPDVSTASPLRDRVTPHWFDHSALGLPWLTWWGFVPPSSSAIWLCYRTSACVRPIHTVVSQNTKREGGGAQLIMAEDKSDGHIFVKFCLGFDGVKLRGEKCLVNNGISNWTWERIINTSSWQQCWWELFSGYRSYRTTTCAVR